MIPTSCETVPAGKEKRKKRNKKLKKEAAPTFWSANTP